MPQPSDSTPRPKRRVARERFGRNLIERTNSNRSKSYEIYFTDPATGKQRFKTLDAKNRTEARTERDVFFTALGKGEAVSPNRLSFEDVGREYLTRLEQQVEAGAKAPRTLAHYKHDLEAHVFPKLGRLPIQKLTSDHLARFFADKREEGLSPYTLAGMRSPISKILKMAVRKRYVASSVLDQLEDDELPKGKALREGRVLNREEIGSLLKHTVEGYQPIIATLVFAGLRMQEALGLQWGDIDFDQNLIRLRWQLSRATKDAPSERVPLKAKGSSRDIRLLGDLRTILWDLRKQALSRGHYGAERFVFATETGKPMYHRNVAVRGLDKAAERAGLNPEGKPRLQPHDLRRTFGSHLALSGLDVVRVSRQIGHSRPSVTLDIYAKEFEQSSHADAVAEKLNEAFRGIIDAGERR